MRGIYILGGYPDLESFENIYKTATEFDLDFIEVGLPFNDPVADGPVISKAVYDAVENKIKIDDILAVTKKYDVKHKLIMTYANILFDYGFEKFSKNYSNLLSGAIIPDIPNKYSKRIQNENFDIPVVPFITPETRDEDLLSLKDTNAPFIYYVGIRGITGSKASYDTGQMKDHINQIKQITDTPVIIGFGIKTRADADKAMNIADGFVIGTEVVKRQKDLNDFKRYLKEIFG